MYNTFWLKNRASLFALKSIYSSFDKLRKIKTLEQRRLICANRIKRKVGNRLQRYADTLDDRNMNQIRHAFNSVMIFTNETAIEKAKKILTSFLVDSTDKYMVFQSNLKFHHKADFLVNFYKARMEIRKAKLKILDKAWEKQILSLTENSVMTKGKNKKVSKLMKKIMVITRDTKQKVIRLYFESRVLKYKVQFLHYYMSKTEFIQDMFSKEANINSYEKLYKEIDLLLFVSDKEGGGGKGESSKKEGSKKNASKKAPTVTSNTIKMAKVAHRESIIPIPLQKPHFTYMLSTDKMIALISRTANMSKKAIEKLDKLASQFIIEHEHNVDLEA